MGGILMIDIYMFFVFCLLILFILFCLTMFASFPKERKKSPPHYNYRQLECVYLGIFLLFFTFTLRISFKDDYTVPHHYLFDDYTPFAHKHVLTLYVFWILSFVSLLIVWIRGRRVPSPILILSLVFILIGVAISIASIMQISDKEYSNYDFEPGLEAPIIYLFFSFILVRRLILEDTDYGEKQIFNNTFPQKLNRSMTNSHYLPLWVVILVIPVFFLVIFILTFLGQEPDSIIKVFTETCTWRFSTIERGS